MDETIVSGSAKAKDFTDDKKKEQFIDEKTLFECVKNGKSETIKCIYEKRTPKTYDVDEKDEDSGDNKAFLNNDVQDVDGSSSKFSKDNEIKFITLEEVEVNKIRDLYKSTSISNNVFESFQSTERIFTAATEEFKSVCPQEEEIINTTATKTDETIVNGQENKEKDANKSKKNIDNDKNIKVEDIEFSGNEKVEELIVPNDVESQNLTGDKDKQWIDEETLPEGVKDECTWYKSIAKTKKSSFEIYEDEYSGEMDGDRKRSLRLDSSFIYNKDEEQIDLQYKIKQKRLEAQKQQKVKSYKSTFIQSLATRSQRLATSVKRLKRSGEAGISAPPQRIRLNDTTAATVTSIKQYTKNNDAEDLLQATWIENDETQISDDDETKKQQQSQQQQDHYLSSSELPIICQPSPSTIPTCKLSEKRYDRHQKGIIIGDHEDNEHNDNPSLVSALCFPKNIDPQMCINGENEGGICVICKKDFLGRLVYHYVNAHRGCEIYNSRLSRSQIKLVKQGRCEVSNVSRYNTHTYYEAVCIFCQKNPRLIASCWYEHFIRHTGEYTYRCTGCGLRNMRHQTVRKHQARKCPKAPVAQDYFRSSKSFFPMEANVCYLCNYVQLYRSNIEKHLHTQHNIEQILPEHIQTIALLSIPTSMTATSTGSINDSSRGDEEVDEIIVPDGAEAEDLTDDKDKEQLIDEQPLFESVEDEKNSKIEAAMNEKETSKICDVDEKDEESGDNKSFLNKDLDYSSSKYSAEDETEFISLEEGELNKIRDLYKSTAKSKSINTNIFESLKSTERIVTAATEEFKGVCPQVEKEINKTTTKIYETIVNIKKAANKAKTIVDNDKSIKVEDIEIPGDEEFNEILPPDVAEAEDLTDYKNKIQLIDDEILPEGVEDEYTPDKSNPKTKNQNESLSENDDDVRSYQTSQSNYLNAVQLQSETTNTTIYSTSSSLPYPNISSLTSSALKRERQHEVDEDEYTTDISKAQEQQVKSDESAFIQSIATRSQRLTTSVKRFKRSTKAEISATVTSIKQYTGNNDAVDLLQATWIKNDETQISDDDESKKQQQRQQQQHHYSSSSELPTIFQPCPSHSPIPTSDLNEQLSERNRKGIIIGGDGDNENNDNSSLVSALDWPKNVDPEMFIDDENKKRCVICNKGFTGRFLVYHYVNEHRGCEIYNSRLSPSQIKFVKEGRCGVSKVSVFKSRKYYEASCIFCQQSLRLISPYWHQHFSRHTGEFAYRCTGCGLRKPMPDFREHQGQGCLKVRVAQDYFRSSKSVLPIEAYVCALCNYVQLYRSNIEKHLHVQHNIKEISPEHIQTISLLSKPTPMTASTGSKIDSKRWNKSGDAPSLQSTSYASNPYVINAHGDNNDLTFDKILPDENTSSQTNLPTNKNTFGEFISSNKSTRDLNNSHVEKNQEIVIDDDDENNDNHTLVSELGFPKNVDPQMFINAENKDRCVICNNDFKCLVQHYVNEHRGCEIYNSRLSPSQIKLVKQGGCEVSNVSVYKRYKYYEAFCIFCEKNLHSLLRYWYEHFTRHTGEFAYRCTGCGMRKPWRGDFRRHQDQGCTKAIVVQDYFHSSKSFLPIEAYVCALCNYVQLFRSNIEKHLHVQHNIKEISPEHIQTIALLSKPTSMTASTGSKIDSKRWNKSGAAPSLQSSVYASNSYAIYDHGDDNDVPFDKILPDETPPQTNPPANKNTFEEFISCNKATRDLNNSDGSLSILLPSHAEKNQEIVIDDNDENNTLVSALDWPKNFDPQMFINDENRDRCVICNKDFNSLVQHYVNEHRGCEIYNSRLSPSQIKLVKQGRCEVSNVIQYKSCKYYAAFCIFCEKILHSKLRYWYEHFTRHTGEFAYRCTCCGLRKPGRPDFRSHQDQGCPKARVVQDYFRRSKSFLPIEANVCALCNYVQLYRSNIEKHLHVQHNIKEISPEHIQTIALLSKPTSMTASTGSKIDSRSWNKTRDLKNSDGFSSLLLPSHADKNQRRIIEDDGNGDDENNDKSSLDSTLDWPKNVDTQVFINDKNKDRCVICNKDFIGRLVNHYVNEHRGCEIYNSRLSRSQIKLVKQGRCEVSNIRLHNNHKYNEAFCIFCQKNLRFDTRYWYYHFTRHTGEYAFRCTGCGLRKPGRDDIKTHQAQGCPTARVAQDYFRSSKHFLPIEAHLCNLCNYVQLDRSNIERHLRIQHNIETIFPEHIQTIVLLSKPACMTDTSTGSVIDSSLGDEEVDEIIVPDGADDEDLTNDSNKEQLIEEKIPSDSVVVEKNCKIKIAMIEKETSKTCDVDEKDEDSGGNKSFLNNDEQDVDDSSSEYSEEYKAEFITLEEDELNKIQVQSSEEFKCVCPQKEEEVNRIDTKSGETIVNIKKNKEKAVKKLETTIDDGKNITATIKEIFENKEIRNNNNIDKEEPEHQKDYKIITNENYHREGTEYDNKEFYGVSDPASEEETEDFDEDVKDVKISGDAEAEVLTSNSFALMRKRQHEESEYRAHKSKPKITNKSSAEIGDGYNEDVEQVGFQHKIKQTRLEAQKQQKVKSCKSTFIQSLVTRSQRLATSVKRLKRSPEAGINASTQSIRLNDTISATVTSIEEYTENLENYEGQVSDYEVKKQQQSQQQQDRYLSKSELPTICKRSPSHIATSKLNVRLYERNQEGIIIGDDDDNENNGDSSLVSALCFPKNVDPQMVINDENKNRCVICNQVCLGRLVYHYINEHRGCEVYNSRLSTSQIKIIEEGRCEVSNVSLHKNHKHYEGFCIFCQENLRFVSRDWYQHFTRHTGEFAYRCTGCGLRKPRRPDFRKHQAEVCPKARVAQDYFRSSKGCPIPVKANVCNLCNYVQLYRNNIEKHLHTQHNIKQILNEHIYTIVLLSKPTSMTATSTSSKIDSRLWNNSDVAAPQESSPQTDDLTINNTFDELTNSYKATGNSNNSGGSPSLFPSHDENNQGIIIRDHDENNDKPSLVSVLGFPKNVDPQMVINDENKERCVICNKDFNNLVHHYVNEHRGCEIYNSRLSPSQIKFVKEGRCEVSKVSVFKNRKYYEASCIFCQQSLRFISPYWHQHFSRHTGEYTYRCTGCGLRKPMRHEVRRHQAQRCPKARVAQDYFRNSKGRLPIEANVCNLCNYVQVHRSNIARHLHTQHNIKQILPEHIQTIALLSIARSVTAPSTVSKTDTKRWNKRDAAPSLLTSSHSSNTYVIDDKDVTFLDKIILEENQTQTNPSTINSSVEELTNSHKATGNLKNSGGSPSVLLPSHAEKNQEGIIIGDDDENNDNLSLVSTLEWPKNDDPQMFITDENKDRCFICNQDFMRRLVNHYVNEHRGCEIYNSRLSPSQIKIIKVGRCEVSNVSLHKHHKHFEAFCIFCQESLRFTSSDWYDHFTRHTGEYAYRCTGCGLRKPKRPNVRRHQAQDCPKARVVQDYFRSSKSFLPIEAYICALCNYVQLYRSNIEKHLHMQHNIKKNILPEHIQTILLLSLPTSMTAISKLSLPSSSHTDEDACNTYLIDNDDKDSDNNVIFEKMVKQETSLQANSPTVNKSFDESTNCHTVICSKIITLADVSAADA